MSQGPTMATNAHCKNKTKKIKQKKNKTKKIKQKK